MQNNDNITEIDVTQFVNNASGVLADLWQNTGYGALSGKDQEALKNTLTSFFNARKHGSALAGVGATA